MAQEWFMEDYMILDFRSRELPIVGPLFFNNCLIKVFSKNTKYSIMSYMQITWTVKIYYNKRVLRDSFIPNSMGRTSVTLHVTLSYINNATLVPLSP